MKNKSLKEFPETMLSRSSTNPLDSVLMDSHENLDLPNNSHVSDVMKFSDTKEYVRSVLKYDNGKCVNAFQIISDPNILYQAYNTIKSNPDNMVHGTDKKTLDGINEK
jgi:hypothetical protein